MSRNLKRVPLDFDWPVNTVWEGYLNPYYGQIPDCSDCGGTGYAPAARLLYALWYRHLHTEARLFLRHARLDLPLGLVAFAQTILASGHGWDKQIDAEDVAALVASGRLWDFTRRPRTDEHRQIVAESGRYWLPEDTGYVPTPDEVNAWAGRGMGHDGINAWVCQTARCARYGLPDTCAVCAGHGDVGSDEQRAARDAWEKVEPPTGDGYQLWEDVTEGSPQSPVFTTLDELCIWCAAHATTFADNTASVAQWHDMLAGGWVHHTEAMGDKVMTFI